MKLPAIIPSKKWSQFCSSITTPFNSAGLCRCSTTLALVLSNPLVALIRRVMAAINISTGAAVTVAPPLSPKRLSSRTNSILSQLDSHVCTGLGRVDSRREMTVEKKRVKPRRDVMAIQEGPQRQISKDIMKENPNVCSGTRKQPIQNYDSVHVKFWRYRKYDTACFFGHTQNCIRNLQTLGTVDCDYKFKEWENRHFL